MIIKRKENPNKTKKERIIIIKKNEKMKVKYEDKKKTIK